jgi:hypothetical protein
MDIEPAPSLTERKENEMDNKVVMFNSEEAAQYKTGLSGWVSRHGHYYGNDERAARYDGCTHIQCEDCGEPTDRGRLICIKCGVIRDIKRYEAMPKEKWNGKGMLYSDAADKYFSDWDEVDGYLEDNEITIESLRLIICEPNYLPLLDSSDYGCDSLADDGELPDTVIVALNNFNKVIQSIGAVSWTPGKKACLIRNKTNPDLLKE